MYSLPTGWHGINLTSPSKKSRAFSHCNAAATRSAKQPKQQSAPQIERRKWNYSVGLDPLKIRSSTHASKKNMPTTKTRARSMVNGGHELRTRTQEEVNVEIMALRKEVAHVRDENTLLKGRLRRLEEDNAKKIKHFEKQLATAKRESLASEKRKESDAVTTLKHKCSRLEQSLKEKDASLKKLQQEKTLLKTREVRSIPESKDPPNARPSLDNKRLLQKSVPRANSVPVAEVTRLKESSRKLQQENSSLQQQLKERDQEIKQLKMQLIRAQKATPPARRTQKVPEVKVNTPATRNHIQDVRPTTSSNYNNSSTVNRSIVKERITTKTTVSEAPIEKKEFHIGDCVSCEDQIQALQKNIAAKRIQRGWRQHRDRATEHEASVYDKEATNGITDEQEGEATVLLQSVLRGHHDRLEYMSHIQEKLEEDGSYQSIQLQQEE